MMMIKNRSITIALLFCISAITFTAQISKGYKYYREIDVVNKTGYYKIPVSSEMLGKSLAQFNDFRVFRVDETDTLENPYLLTWNESSSNNQYVEEKIIDVAYKKGIASYITVKLEQVREINQIHLNVDESDFDKTLTIEGSNDNKHWKTIKEDIRIVGFGQEKFSFSTLYFPTSSYNYYLITFNDKSSKPITVSSVKTILNTDYKAVYEKIKDTYIVKKEIKKNLTPAPGKERIYENYTEIKINLPYTACLSYLQLKSRDKTADFYRNLSVLDSKGNEISLATFTSLERDGITTVYLDRAVGRDFVVRVFNNDNPPVEGINVDVFGMNAFLLTKLEPEEKYILAYGNSKASPVQYDLTYFSTKIIDIASDLGCKTEMSFKTTPVEKKQPLVTQQKWLWITLIALVVLLGLFAFSLMKKVNKS